MVVAIEQPFVVGEIASRLEYAASPVEEFGRCIKGEELIRRRSLLDLRGVVSGVEREGIRGTRRRFVLDCTGLVPLAGVPGIPGRGVWQDFERWRQSQMGLNDLSVSKPAMVLGKVESQRLGLPPQAARIVAEFG